MTTSCDLATQDMGAGVAAALTAVDCIAGDMSEKAFSRLFGAEGELAIVLTVLLTFYVAFFGISLILGRSNLSIRSLIPRTVTIGLVIAFATSYVVFQGIFYNIFVLGPDWISGLLSENDGSATVTFATKLDIVFLAIQQASNGTDNINAFSPVGMMWLGAMLLLLGTVGLLVTARIGLALLLAVGPIFVVLALFNGTRGLFVGWLKGLVMLALAPIFAVVGGSIMLEMAVPILAVLVSQQGVAGQPGVLNQQAAMAFFVVGFVHVLLMLMVLKVASNMVAGWQVFGLAMAERTDERGRDTTQMLLTTSPLIVPENAERRAAAVAKTPGQRRIDVSVPSPVPIAAAANDTNSSSGAASIRETKVYATTSGRLLSDLASTGASRTRGIGSRFRTASGIGAVARSETRK